RALMPERRRGRTYGWGHGDNCRGRRAKRHWVSKAVLGLGVEGVTVFCPDLPIPGHHVGGAQTDGAADQCPGVRTGEWRNRNTAGEYDRGEKRGHVHAAEGDAAGPVHQPAIERVAEDHAGGPFPTHAVLESDAWEQAGGPGRAVDDGGVEIGPIEVALGPEHPMVGVLPAAADLAAGRA